MARKIGKHIRAICEVLEQHGPSGSTTVSDWTGEGPENTGKNCIRAVRYGLLTVEEGLHSRINYNVYTVVDGWRSMLGDKDIEPVKSTWRLGMVNSIFNLRASA